MQAPGGTEEDALSGFKYGGWVAPYFVEADEAAGEFMQKQMKSADLLSGRKTFEVFVPAIKNTFHTLARSSTVAAIILVRNVLHKPC